MIKLGLSLGLAYAFSPVTWFTTEVHYRNDKYELVFDRVENCVWKKMGNAPANIFVYYPPAIWCLNGSVNGIFNAGSELMCYFLFAVCIPDSSFTVLI